MTRRTKYRKSTAYWNRIIVSGRRAHAQRRLARLREGSTFPSFLSEKRDAQ